MNIATATLRGISPYSQSRHYETPEKGPKESSSEYEKRTWRERLHVNEEGFVFAPPMAFKNCLSEAAKFLSIRIPGGGKATWTKHFEAGVLVMEPLVLPIKKEDVPGTWLFVPSDGRRGSGSRVSKCFPTLQSWGGKVTFYVLDEKIDRETFKYHLDEAGKFIGIGYFRPRNNGFWGRFVVDDLKWEKG